MDSMAAQRWGAGPDYIARTTHIGRLVEMSLPDMDEDVFTSTFISQKKKLRLMDG